MADDLAFTFDTSFFEKGVNKIVKGFSTIETKANTVAKGVSKGLSIMAGKLAIVFAGFKTIKNALLGMPEVGQAFGIAKDIFMKNLLYPLRKELFPLLQKMLNWVRDSRVRFVKWGQNIANIFRAVVSGAKRIIAFVKQMSTVVANIAEKIFGDRIKSIEDIFNLVAFKLSVIIQFISILVEKAGNIFAKFAEIFFMANNEGNSFITILSTIAELFMKTANFVIKMADRFIDGFLPAIREIATPIQNILDTFGRIRDMIFTSTDAMETWGAIFEGLGSILGGAIMLALQAIESIVLGIEKIFLSIEKIKEEGFLGAFKSSVETGKESGITGAQRAGINIDVPEGVTNSSSDTSYTTVVPIDFTGMRIIVENGGAEEGQELGTNLVETIRDELNKDYERFGF